MFQIQFDRVGKPEGKLSIKRARVSTTCFSCRRKKVKCDKRKPCSNCIKTGHQDDCTYELIKWANIKLDGHGEVTKETESSNTVPKIELKGSKKRTDSTYVGRLEKEVKKLKLQVERMNSKSIENDYALPLDHPFVDEARTISFYDGYNLVQLLQGQYSNHGPYNWCTIIKKDKFLKIGWYALFITQEKRLRGASGTGDLQFSNSFLPSGYFFRSSTFATKIMKQEKEDRSAFMKTIGDYTKKNEILKAVKIHDGADHLESQVKQYLLSVLPKKKTFWICVIRFFRYCYPFMPYLDQADFIDDASVILEATNFADEPFEKIDLKNEKDYFKLATMLLVVALGQLSLGTLEESPNASNDDLYLRENPVGLEVVRAAHRCVHQFLTSITSSLPALQSILYLRLYQRYSAESGESIDPSTRILNGMILQMALSLGFNHGIQDISKLPPKQQKKFNLRAKIWTGIKSLEFYQNYALGNSSSVVIDTSESLFPEKPTEDNKNAFDIKLDTVSYEKQMLNSKMESVVIKNLSCTLDLKKKTNVVKLIAGLEIVERFLKDNYGTLDEILLRKTDADSTSRIAFYFSKLSDLATFLSVSTLCFVIRNHIFLLFEADDDPKMALYYFNKLFQQSNEFSEAFYYIVHHASECFEGTFQFAIVPSLEMANHRFKLVTWAALYRIILHKANLLLQGELPDDLRVEIDSCIKLCVSISQIQLITLDKLATKYYYAWRMGKAHLAIHSLLFAPAEKGELPTEPVPIPETGKKGLQMKYDEDGITPLPGRSFITGFDRRDFKELYIMMKSAVDYGLSQNFIKQFQMNEDYSVASRTTNDFGDNSILYDFETLTSVEADTFWSDLLLKNSGFEVDAVAMNFASDGADPSSLYFPELFSSCPMENPTDQDAWSAVAGGMDVCDPNLHRMA